MTFFHLLSTSDWDRALEEGSVSPASLATEGFAHCSTAAQLPGVVERFYEDTTGLLAAEIDPSLLGAAELRWEAPAHPDGSPNTHAEEHERYPHVYGPVPVTAVVRTVAAATLLTEFPPHASPN